MEDWVAPLLLGLFGGGTIGILGTAYVTVSHERAERFRDRQFEAASMFMADFEAALLAVVAVWEAATEVDDARDDAKEAADVAAAEHEALEVVDEMEDVLDLIGKATRVGLDLMGRSWSERATDEISRSRAVIEEAIENLAGRMDEPLATSGMELLRSLQEASDALAVFIKASRQSRARLQRVIVSLAKLNLLFAGEDAEVVEAARQADEGLVLLLTDVLRPSLARIEKPEPPPDRTPEEESEGISDKIQGVNQLLADFAAVANARVRPRPLVRDLVGRG